VALLMANLTGESHLSAGVPFWTSRHKISAPTWEKYVPTYHIPRPCHTKSLLEDAADLVSGLLKPLDFAGLDVANRAQDGYPLFVSSGLYAGTLQNCRQLTTYVLFDALSRSNFFN
jgi:hypothetical protein